MNDLTKGNVVRQLLIFSLPLIFSDLVQGLLSIVDMVYLGKLIGYQGIASVSVAIPVVFFLLAVLIGMNASTNIMIGQAFGSSNKNNLRLVITNSFTITIVISFFVAFMGVTISELILKLMNVPSNIFYDALSYLRVYIISIPLSAMMMWIMGITRGFGNSKFSLYSSILLLFGKLALTPLFIKGFGIIPSMGVVGAILSSVVVELGIMVFGFFYIVKKYDIVRQSLKLSLDKEIVFKFFSVGLPASLQMLIISFSFGVVMGFVAHFGEESIAVFGIGNRIDQFAFLPALSLSMALVTISSQNLSANREDRVSEFLKWAIVISFSISLIVVFLVNVFGKGIFSFFVNNERVINLGVEYLRVMSLSYVLMGFVFSVQGVVRGAGDTLAILGIKAFSMILVRVPVAYLLGFLVFESPIGVWMSFPAVMAFEMIASWVYFKSQRWKRKIMFRKQKKIIDAGI
ncbi:MAG: MATE family efflux transporter [Brevinematales bacterium]|nr:MATE family efflux transporter [Brevinematales bacterium]